MNENPTPRDDLPLNPDGSPVPAYPATPDVAPAQGWREAYLKERTKSRILAVTTAGAAVIAVIAGIWGFSQASSTPTAAVGGAAGGPAAGGFGGPGFGGPGGYGPGMAPPDGMRGGLLTQLLNADGTVNEDAVAQFKAQSAAGNGPPPALIAQLAAREVARGDLTQAQADALLAALGVTAGGASASPSKAGT